MIKSEHIKNVISVEIPHKTMNNALMRSDVVNKQLYCLVKYKKNVLYPIMLILKIYINFAYLAECYQKITFFCVSAS